jgi:formylglycine-generating enzyme required for sulfatase activity
LNDVKPGEVTLEKWIELQGGLAGDKCRIIKKNNKYSIEHGYEMHPVIYVSFFGAHAYARWAGKLLPTEQEWEKAARGTDGRIYPWRNEFRADFCNAGFNINHTTPVYQFHQGESPYGCYDMAGNVWEWTSSIYDKDKDIRVLRGGTWFNFQDNCRCASRNRSRPTERDETVGFRCAGTV